MRNTDPRADQPTRAHGPRRVTAALATLAALASTLIVTVLTPAPAGAAPVALSNTAAITIPGSGSGGPTGSPASPYPSPITVSGLSGTVLDVDVTVNGLTHAVVSDVELLLVGPTGQSVVLMTDAGGNGSLSGASFTLDDEAAATIPNPIVSGSTYKPLDRDVDGAADVWPAPAPVPGGSLLSAFDGTAPNGTWNLYVADDAEGDVGAITGGWTLTVDAGTASLPGSLQLSSATYTGTEGSGSATVTVTRVGGSDGTVSATLATGSGTATAGADYTPVSQTVTFTAGQTSQTVSIPIADDPSVEGIDETVPVTLSGPTGGATLGSPTSAVLRIQDDDSRANAHPIAIPGTGTGSISGAPADLYPSNVVVAGAGGVVTDVNVTVTGLSHTTPMDAGLLLVAPNGATTLLMSDVGSGANPVSGIDLTFDDEAAGGIPASGAITGGTFRPTDDDLDDDGSDLFPAPAPAGPWGATLGALDGTSPNGVWSLYVVDDAAADVGSISGGWSLGLTTATASAGGPYSTAEGSGVTLSGSTTPALPGATFEWDVDGDGQYDDATGATPTVSGATLASIGLGDGPDSSSVRLRVTSGSAVITSTATTLTVTNVAPTATLGNDGPVVQGDGATVTFTGQTDPSAADTTAGFRYSYDLDDDGDWEIGDGTYAGGSTSASASVPASLLASVGTHDVRARIIDKDGGSSTYSTTITVDAPPNAAADADAGPDQLVNPGDTVTLDGTGSSDADDDPFTSSWVQIAGPSVTLTGASTAQPTFTAPSGPATLTFRLTVDDDGAGPHSDSDTVTITVNGPPTAAAGADEEVNLGDTVTLDGTGSTDPDGDTLTYSWTQTGGTAVALTGATTAEPTFTAPEGPASLTLELTVDDGVGGTATDTVTITVNGPPAADAGDDQSVVELTEVTLDGTGSTDPDGDALTYSWVQTGGAAVTLTGATTAEPTFTAPLAPGTLTFELTVDDGAGRTDTDTVTVTLQPRFTPDEAFVDHTFQVLLGRPADPAGLAYWVGRLEGGLTRVAMARQLALSVEGTTRTVDQRYRAWLGRPVDAAARDHWVAYVRAGGPLVDVELAVLSSGELYTRAGGTDAAYVTELFELLLGRTPDAASLAYFEGRLTSGASRRSVASTILGSPECEQRRVRDAYQRILGRAPTAAQLERDAALLDTTRDLRAVEYRLAAQWVNRPGSST